MIFVAGESLIDLLVRRDGSVTATPGGGPFHADPPRSANLAIGPDAG